jgi:hypothetical protein
MCGVLPGSLVLVSWSEGRFVTKITEQMFELIRHTLWRGGKPGSAQASIPLLRVGRTAAPTLEGCCIFSRCWERRASCLLDWLVVAPGSGAAAWCAVAAVVWQVGSPGPTPLGIRRPGMRPDSSSPSESVLQSRHPSASICPPPMTPASRVAEAVARWNRSTPTSRSSARS